MLVRASEVYTLFPPLLRYARDVKRQSGFDFMFGGNKREKEKKTCNWTVWVWRAASGAHQSYVCVY